MNPSSRRGETAWVGPCRTTSNRTTYTPCRWPRGAVRCGWRSGVARTTPAWNPRSHWRYLRRWVGDATSAAAGGPSAAMPTATVRRGVAASDDRKRDAAQLRAPRPRSATGTQRRRRPSLAHRCGFRTGLLFLRRHANRRRYGFMDRLVHRRRFLASVGRKTGLALGFGTGLLSLRRHANRRRCGFTEGLV